MFRAAASARSPSARSRLLGQVGRSKLGGAVVGPGRVDTSARDSLDAASAARRPASSHRAWLATSRPCCPVHLELVPLGAAATGACVHPGRRNLGQHVAPVEQSGHLMLRSHGRPPARGTMFFSDENATHFRAVEAGDRARARPSVLEVPAGVGSTVRSVEPLARSGCRSTLQHRAHLVGLQPHRCLCRQPPRSGTAKPGGTLNLSSRSVMAVIALPRRDDPMTQEAPVDDSRFRVATISTTSPRSRISPAHHGHVLVELDRRAAPSIVQNACPATVVEPTSRPAQAAPA